MTDEKRSAHEVYHDDVHALLETLGLGTHARPESPHHVLRAEILPAIRGQQERIEALEAENERLRGLLHRVLTETFSGDDVRMLAQGIGTGISDSLHAKCDGHNAVREDIRKVLAERQQGAEEDA